MLLISSFLPYLRGVVVISFLFQFPTDLEVTQSVSALLVLTIEI